MKPGLRRAALALLCILVWPLMCVGAGQVEPAFVVPAAYQLVNDHAQVLTVEQGVEMTAKLQAAERANGTQIVFLSVPSIGDEGLAVYAHEVMDRWDLGNNGEANGVLFLVTASQGVFIATGRGISGALPDAKVVRILRETLAPHFERGEFQQGMMATVDELIVATRTEGTTPTSLPYGPDGMYLAPELGLMDRLLLTGAWKPLVARALTVALVLYLAAMGFRRWRRKRSAQ
jgi:uncharacterized membrane protein YgcG